MSLSQKDLENLAKIPLKKSSYRNFIASQWEKEPSSSTWMKTLVGHIIRCSPLTIAIILLGTYFFEGFKPLANAGMFITWIIIILTVGLSIIAISGTTALVQEARDGNLEAIHRFLKRGQLWYAIPPSSSWRRYSLRAQHVMLILVMASLTHYITAVGYLIAWLIAAMNINRVKEEIMKHIEEICKKGIELERTIDEDQCMSVQ